MSRNFDALHEWRPAWSLIPDQWSSSVSARELAAELGVVIVGIHHMLHALGETRLFILVCFSKSKNKPRYSYVLTQKGFSEKAVIVARFQQRTRVEYEALGAEIEELSAELERGQGGSVRSAGIWQNEH